MKNHIHQLIAGKESKFPRFSFLFENNKRKKTGSIQENKNDNEFLKNKVVIVTGASSGIGRAISLEMAKKGANVILAARNEMKLQALMSEINNKGGLAIAMPTDVSDENQCQELINNVIWAFGKIDVLINNAGISMRANFQNVDLTVLKKLMDTNFWGTVYCTKYALPHILGTGGSIIGISSICGITPLPGRTGYAASKHALDGFLGTLRIETMEKNLHVMIVHPGFTTSNIRNVALNKDGIPQEESPLNENKLMPAEKVAKEITLGILNKKREITLTTEGKLITWLYRRIPNVAEKLIYREMKKETGSPIK
ncbi:MAG: SDR family oxidoreductase [Bacteroidota bacterium]